MTRGAHRAVCAWGAVIAACAALVGCDLRIRRVIPEPVPRACPADAGVVDAGVRTCDAPALVDPESIVDLDGLRAGASALVCDWALDCGWGVFGESFCHPGFAALYARRGGVDSVPFDVESGRACVRGLRDAASCDAALEVAYACLDLSGTAFGAPPGASCESDGDCSESTRCASGVCRYRAEGDPCGFTCRPGLACVEGRCAAGLACGGACTSASECARGMQCIAGECAFGAIGDPCDLEGPGCARGLVCPDARESRCQIPSPAGSRCSLFTFTYCEHGGCTPEGICVTRGHIGCECTIDAECPTDVSVCIDGRCVARPMDGEACIEGGAACFGSVCEAGTCRRLRVGESPCFADSDCDDGLVCDASRTCGPPLAEGAACGAGVLGRCADGLRCSDDAGGTCVR